MVVLLAIVLLVYEVPFPQSFSGQLSVGRTSSVAYDVAIPDGVSVTGTWSALGAQSVALTITSPQGTPVFEGTGNAGGFGFVSVGGTYQFNGTSPVAQLVSVQGSYPATILQLLNLEGGT
jgi:hypothetical protein